MDIFEKFFHIWNLWGPMYLYSLYNIGNSLGPENIDLCLKLTVASLACSSGRMSRFMSPLITWLYTWDTSEMTRDFSFVVAASFVVVAVVLMCVITGISVAVSLTTFN